MTLMEAFLLSTFPHLVGIFAITILSIRANEGDLYIDVLEFLVKLFPAVRYLLVIERRERVSANGLYEKFSQMLTGIMLFVMVLWAVIIMAVTHQSFSAWYILSGNAKLFWGVEVLIPIITIVSAAVIYVFSYTSLGIIILDNIPLSDRRTSRIV